MLRKVFDLDIEPAADAADWFEVGADEAFVVVAQEGAGGVFLQGVDSGRVIFISSEGQWAPIAGSDSALIQLVITCPYWADLIKFSDGLRHENMLSSAERLEREWLDDEPDLPTSRETLAAILGGLESRASVIDALHGQLLEQSCSITIRDRDGEPFEDLYGISSLR